MKLLLSNPWVAVGLVVAIFVSGIVAGKAWESNQRDAQAASVSIVATETAAELVSLRTANSEYERKLKELSDIASSNEQAALANKARAEAAAEEARLARVQTLAKDAEWKRKFAQALKTPQCAELLEMKVCEIAPMP